MTQYEISPRQSGRHWEARSGDGTPLLFETAEQAAKVTAMQIIRRDGGTLVSLEPSKSGVWMLAVEPPPEDRLALAGLPRSNPFCETCRWWHVWEVQSNPSGTFGECRRNSPVLALVRNHADQDRYLSKWPNTRAQDWCGRHAATPGGIPLDGEP